MFTKTQICKTRSVKNDKFARTWNFRSRASVASRLMTVAFFLPYRQVDIWCFFRFEMELWFKAFVESEEKFRYFSESSIGSFFWGLTIVGKLLLYKASHFRVPKALSIGLTYFLKFPISNLRDCRKSTTESPRGKKSARRKIARKFKKITLNFKNTTRWSLQ